MVGVPSLQRLAHVLGRPQEAPPWPGPGSYPGAPAWPAACESAPSSAGQETRRGFTTGDTEPGSSHLGLPADMSPTSPNQHPARCPGASRPGLFPSSSGLCSCYTPTTRGVPRKELRALGGDPCPQVLCLDDPPSLAQILQQAPLSRPSCRHLSSSECTPTFLRSRRCSLRPRTVVSRCPPAPPPRAVRP